MQIELDLYSGRPNPSWSLTSEEASELAQRLSQLQAVPAVALPEALGYRGLRFQHPGMGWVTVGAGVVLSQEAAPAGQQRADPHRALECWLLGTAQGRLEEGLRQIGVAALGAGCA